MLHQFTPAAERALAYAADWASRADCTEVEAPAVLAGLLAEIQCRAAILSARAGINLGMVHERWHLLKRSNPSIGEGSSPSMTLSADLETSLQAVERRFAFYAQPIVLATEHILLGLAISEHEVGVWLRGQGLDPESIEADMRRIYDYRSEELEMGKSMEYGGEKSTEYGVQSTESDECSAAAGTAAPSPEPPAPSPDLLNTGATRPGSSLPTAHYPLPTPGSALPTAPCPLPTDVFRILDAAANRAREGLRTVEDYVRFVLDDRYLTEQCKLLRHDLAAALQRIAPEQRLAARETLADVGTTLTTLSEQSREGLVDILAAAFARVQEALRSLEEFGKLLEVALSAEFKRLRYVSYTLERAIGITRSSLERLAGARLYVLIDGRTSMEDFARLAKSLIDAGAHVLQLRDKRLDDRQLLERARLLRELTQGTPTLFIVNDRPDLAALSRADGVHVGQEELAVKDARRIVGPEALIGVSTHSIEQARQAVLDGADYIGVGPTFPSPTKQFEHFPGLELLRAVAGEIRLPAFAIGGITLEDLPEVLATGLHRVAVGSALLNTADPDTMAIEMLRVLNS
jgi:thiamine-phosphate pyrophosphorylase